jgi:hypothetical protein
MKAYKTTKGQGIPDHKRNSKKVGSNIDLIPHNQTLKKQRQLNDRNHHTPINKC